MSLLLLKKKIQERIDGLYGEGRQTKASKNDILELKWVLCLIDELEKEESTELEKYKRLADYWRSSAKEWREDALQVPVWSGRSEAEIREQLAKTTQYLQRQTLEWVLSPSQKKEPFPNTASCSACGEISRGTDEENSKWVDEHKENCREWKKPLKKGEYKDIMLVSSAPKEKCGHQKNGRVCVMPKDHLGETEHSDKKVYWSDSAPKVKDSTDKIDKILGPNNIITRTVLAEAERLQKEIEVSRSKPKEKCKHEPSSRPPKAWKVGPQWIKCRKCGELFGKEDIEVSREEKPKAPYHCKGWNPRTDAPCTARMTEEEADDGWGKCWECNERRKYTLAEMADLVEKIQKCAEENWEKKNPVMEELAPYVFATFNVRKQLIVGVVWTLLFRENPDLVERIRKGEVKKE